MLNAVSKVELFSSLAHKLTTVLAIFGCSLSALQEFIFQSELFCLAYEW